ncbi:conserved protein of unknown function [Pseudomonas marincola]|uniref:Uncharacterized protein n=1 Tax=Pseudomonas marincola TaxID=437900 RepID=A0A653E520_9PSED|nr:conserved protein of unknown function [Pseudomonas marincola]
MPGFRASEQQRQAFFQPINSQGSRAALSSRDQSVTCRQLLKRVGEHSKRVRTFADKTRCTGT